jgi:Asp-tRNA(Asn)/Glu-tRNA(Gln) amidotransferase C subunit
MMLIKFVKNKRRFNMIASILYPTEERREEVIAQLTTQINEILTFEKSLDTEVRNKLETANLTDLGALASALEIIECAAENVLTKLVDLSQLVNDKIASQV